MSLIGDKIKQTNRIFYLVDLLFPGGTKRISTKTIEVPTGLDTLYRQKWSDGTLWSNGTSLDNQYIASRINLFGKSGVATHVEIHGRSSYQSTNETTVQIWTNDTGATEPNLMLAETEPLSHIYCSAEGDHLLRFLEPVLLNGDETYWLVIYTPYDGTTYFQAGVNQYGNNLLKSGNATPVWATETPVYNIDYNLLSIQNAKLYDGIINSIGGVGSTFDIRGFTHSIGSISVTTNNNQRLQDLEVRQVVDGSKCLVRIWSEGLTWREIERAGIIYSGRFKKENHSKDEYTFVIESGQPIRMKTIPGVYVTDATFPNHRKDGGGGSVSGAELPMIWGEFTKGLPLICTHTTNYEYALCIGNVESDWNDYWNTDQNVYDKDGTLIISTAYNVHSAITEKGIPYTYFDFSADRASDEGLSCSVRGYVDSYGDITSRQGKLIEAPVDIIQDIVKNYSIDYEIEDISRTRAESLTRGLSFAVYVNKTVNALDLIKRIANQAQLSVVERYNKIALIAFDLTGVPLGYYHTDHEGWGDPVFYKTDINNIVNSLTLNYEPNIASGQYESQLVKNHLNNSLCKRSLDEYGEVPEIVINLPDVRTLESAEIVANKFLAINALRHDLIMVPMKFEKGHELLEGDIISWTMPEGPSYDGKGFIDQDMILLEKTYQDNMVMTKWWRINIDVNLGGLLEETVGYVLDSEQNFIFDSKGNAIRDSRWRMKP